MPPSLIRILTAVVDDSGGCPESVATTVSWISCFIKDAGMPLLLAYSVPVVWSKVKPFTGVRRE
jgi:hypothetical protein